MSDINPSATTAAQDSRISHRLEAGLTAPDLHFPATTAIASRSPHCAARISS